MKKILSIIALTFTTAAAADSNVGYSLSGATDGTISLRRHTVHYMPNSFGLAANTTNYQLPTDTKETNGLQLIADYRTEKYWLFGSLGAAQGDKTYLQGDITGTYHLAPRIDASVGVFGDLLEGVRALPVEISMQGLIGSAEYNHDDKYGVVGGVKEIYFSDGNRREEFFVKPWLQLVPGVSAYVTIRDYTSAQLSRFYFSPERYNRSGAGIRYRFPIKGIRFSGFIEQTTIKTPFASEPATAWKVQAEEFVGKSTKIVAMYGSDIGAASGFKYQYFDISIRHYF